MIQLQALPAPVRPRDAASTRRPGLTDARGWSIHRRSMLGPDSFELDAQLIRAAIYANNVIQRVTTRLVYGQAGLTLPQYLVLLLLREAQEPLSLSELAARAHVIKQAMTSAYQRLLAKGLVAEVPNTKDRRMCRVVLTPAGERLLADVEPARRSLYEDWLGNLSLEEREEAVNVLQHIVRTEPEITRKHRAGAELTVDARFTAL
ncbi:MAG: MarR family winged helix-turn-helix transcriptional regulator [Chloroflexota bacterium]